MANKMVEYGEGGCLYILILTMKPLVIMVFIPLILALSYASAQPQGIERGAKLFKDKGCNFCHSIGGSGGTVGPRLDRVGNRRDRGWLLRWLKDPPAMKPGTLMPIPVVTDEERNDLIEFLLSNRVEVDRGLLSLPPRQAGAALVKEYDCSACHIIKGEGGKIGPELTQVGKRRDGAWLSRWLKNPQEIKPGTFMPTFPFSEEEIRALVAFLSGLK